MNDDLEKSIQESRNHLSYMRGYYAGQKAMLEEWIEVEHMPKEEQIAWAMKQLLALSNSSPE